ncbi:MAG TPA: PQQ-binding-like beta-propeller repeat protein [Steroidobacteraceae bacterium]|jgi:alcohol dehydrogenase (cytochrome c)
MRRLKWLIVVIVAGALLLAAAAFASGDIRWRLHLLGEKAGGKYPEATWGEFLRMLAPSSGIWLEDLSRWDTLYPIVTNPYRSSADRDAGKKLFAANCGTCHGADALGGGVGPSLKGRISPRTESDWSAFRTVRYGIAGTPMTGLALNWQDTWRLAGFVRSMVVAEDATQAAQVVAVSPVTSERLRNAQQTPQDWLTYGGDLTGSRYSALTQITPQNAQRLRVAWVSQPMTDYRRFEATPLVADGRMYVSYPPSNVVALDAATGKVLWTHSGSIPADMPGAGSYKVSRGVALLDDKVFLATLDCKIKALDAATGKVLWQHTVASYKDGYSFTSAPLAIDGMVVIGNAGGDYATRGFVVALDATDGKERWRFETIPKPGEPNADSWSGDSWKIGGAAAWQVGSYDAELKRVYWGIGNPAPDHFGEIRRGDNLYANTLVALDGATGKLVWHYQFTPHDLHDWDSTQVPVLALGGGRERILFANRNGFLYSIERATGKFEWAKAFVKQTWLESMSPEGRPTRRKEAVPSLEGTVIYPSVEGGTNWWPPAYDASRDVFYVPYMERASMYYLGQEEEPEQAKLYMLGSSKGVSGELFYTGIRAFRAADGELLWEQRNAQRDDIPETNGLVATGGGVVFGADLDRVFAVDAASGKEVWQFMSGGRISAAPMSYAVNGKQYVAITAQRVIMVFELPPE